MRKILPLAFLLAACTPAGQSPPGVVPSAAPSAAAAQIVDLAPPPPGEGVQMTVGPFDVAAGTEVQKNFYMKLPSDKDVMVTKIQVHYPTGSHHCNLFKSDKVAEPDHVADTFDAIDYTKYDMFAAAQTGNLDWALPNDLALKLKANQQLLIQTHWVNASTQKTPGDKGQVKINFWFAKDPAKVKPLGMAFIINKNIDIPPRTSVEQKKFVDFKTLGYDQDVNVIALTGHFHSRGKTFELNRLNADGKTKADELYRSTNWDEPPFKIYDQPFALKAGEKLLYTATFVNNGDAVIKFGPKVETQEHSNLFMYFYPAPPDGRAIYDTNGLP